MSNPNSSMGDVFRQRRAAAAAASTVSGDGGLSEIQQQSQRPSPRGSHNTYPVDEHGRLLRPAGGGSRGRESPRGPGGGGGCSGAAPYGRRDGGEAPFGRHERGGRGDGRHPPRRTAARGQFPVEQGVIRTLLDKFGFILCAERDRELFFHYSEVTRGGWNVEDLVVGSEVEFRVGPSEERGGRRSGGADGEKLSAFDVRPLPKNTVKWEYEDEPVGQRRRGMVDRAASREEGGRRSTRERHSCGRGGVTATEGTIRLIDGDANAGGASGVDKEDAPAIFYTRADYAPVAPVSSMTRGGPSLLPLSCRDIVEFTLVTERRTQKKYARGVILVQAERDRLQEERERQMLANATTEEGRVSSWNGEFGFLKSITRKEAVYVHAAHLVLPESGAKSLEGSATRDTRTALREGQDVKFYVIEELPSTGAVKKGPRLAARKVELLPWGSVKFEHIFAKGVTGMVVSCPVADVDTFGRSGSSNRKNGRSCVADKGGGGGRANSNAKFGNIRLQQPILVSERTPAEDVTHVTLDPTLYPGGTFALSRTGSETGCWIRPGDVLLFDVVTKVMDGSYHAVPTKCVWTPDEAERETSSTARDLKDNDSPSAKSPAIRLIEPSLLSGRSHGTIKVVSENYGFIEMAERKADVYFSMFEVFPEAMQNELNGNGFQTVLNKGGRIHMEAGMEVAFDISLQLPTSYAPAEQEHTSGGGRYHKRPMAQPKESLRARRVQILPKGTVFQKTAVAKGVKASVIKKDPKQLLCGTLSLEEELRMDTKVQLKMRHPLAAQLLEDISAGKYACCNEEMSQIGGTREADRGVTMNEVLSERDASYITTMVDSWTELGLGWTHISKNDPRLCFFQRRKCKSPGADDLQQQRSIVASSDSLDSVPNKASEHDKGKTPPTNVEGKKTEAHMTNAVAVGTPQKKGKKPNTTVRSLRFKNNSFPSEDIASTLPLQVGDVVTCDIYQFRRSGAYVPEKMKVLNRKEGAPTAAVMLASDKDCAHTPTKKIKGLVGFVGEVFINRQFGFIVPVEEDGEKRGKDLFFHLSEVKIGSDDGNNAGVAQDNNSNKSSGRSDAMSSVIRKGDEVKFDIGKSGKNGKPTAANISILPRGTLKFAPIKHSKADLSKMCTGYILMEPSHTSFVNTPAPSIAQQSGVSAGAGVAVAGGSSRWDKVRNDAASNKILKPGTNTTGEGVILLLSDPLGLFSSKPKVADGQKKTNGEEVDAALEIGNSNAAEVSRAKAESNNAIKVAKISGEADSTKTAPVFIAGTHLHYRASSVVRGFPSGPNASRNSDAPRRGDLVTFSKPKGVKLVKDIRIEKSNAATCVDGVLDDICTASDTAVFSVLSKHKTETRYDIRLTDVVSCDKRLLKEKEQVNGILHEGQIFGVCRTKDIYLESSLGRPSGRGDGSGLKERPKLNLTVKKELQGMGGKIMAQSQMAKGPISGSYGFVPGWTTRVSPYYIEEAEKDKPEAEKEEEEGKVTILKSKETEEEPPMSLSAAASEFVPNFSATAPSSNLESGGGGHRL